MARTLFEHLRDHYSGVAVKLYYIDFKRYLKACDVTREVFEDAGTDLYVWEESGEIREITLNGWHRFDWEGVSFETVTFTIPGSCGSDTTRFLLAPSMDAIHRFMLAYGAWEREDRDTILVFEGGEWKADEDLLASVQDTRFDNLILEGSLKEQLKGDIRQWLDAREVYKRYRIPWKRGILLMGEPGNGKTHAVKAIANEFDLRILYVRNFSDGSDYDEGNIKAVFEKARESAPCLLVLEDLDTLVTPENRSYFLNEMDGFASNEGILTIGTANNPEKLDPALAERPSRFDRRYTFTKPAITERERYLREYTEQLEPALRLGDDAAEVAEATDGFSFAYLKELVLSAMMDWISRGGEGPFLHSLTRHAEALGKQMRNEGVEPHLGEVPMVSPPVPE